MIKVSCGVKSTDEKTEQYMYVESSDELRGAVNIIIEGPTASNNAKITVNADDLIQAAENCRNNNRLFGILYSRRRESDDE